MHRDNGHSDARRFHERVETRKVRNGFEIWGAGFGAGAYSTEWGFRGAGQAGLTPWKITSYFHLLSACFLRWVWHWLTKTTSYEVILKGEVGWHHSEKSQIHVYLDETPSRCPKFGGNRTLGVFQAISKFQVQMERLVDELGAPRAAWWRKLAIVSSDDPFIKGICGFSRQLIRVTGGNWFLQNREVLISFTKWKLSTWNSKSPGAFCEKSVSLEKALNVSIPKIRIQFPTPV